VDKKIDQMENSQINLLNEIWLEMADCCNYLWMDEETYLELLQLVSQIIKKEDNILRTAIIPHNGCLLPSDFCH
jgi:hypothetical protein